MNPKLKELLIIAGMVIFLFGAMYVACQVDKDFTKNAEAQGLETTESTIVEPTQTETIILTDPTIMELAPVISPRYGFTDDDIHLLAQLLCGDADINGDGEYDFVWAAKHKQPYYYEMTKVLCVVMNRQRHKDFPDTIYKILMQDGQFTPMPENLATHPDPIAIDAIRDWCEAYDAHKPEVQTIPEDHLYFRAGPNLTNITSTSWR